MNQRESRVRNGKQNHRENRNKQKIPGESSIRRTEGRDNNENNDGRRKRRASSLGRGKEVHQRVGLSNPINTRYIPTRASNYDHQARHI